jgi:hypothetical protein
VTWPGRLRQIHSFFRARSPDEMLDTAAPWTSPWLPPGYEQNLWNAAFRDGWATTLRYALLLLIRRGSVGVIIWTVLELLSKGLVR